MFIVVFMFPIVMCGNTIWFRISAHIVDRAGWGFNINIYVISLVNDDEGNVAYVCCAVTMSLSPVALKSFANACAYHNGTKFDGTFDMVPVSRCSHA